MCAVLLVCRAAMAFCLPVACTRRSQLRVVFNSAVFLRLVDSIRGFVHVNNSSLTTFYLVDAMIMFLFAKPMVFPHVACVVVVSRLTRFH